MLTCDIVFLCLPTLFNEITNTYDKSSIHDVCQNLQDNRFQGLVIFKSTIEPESTNKLSESYPELKLCHNPEFLTARTAFEDFHNQENIVIGFTEKYHDNGLLKKFYSLNYPNAEINICSALESEAMKIFCNSFYASKVVLFNEYYLLCQKNGADFETIKNLMLKNNWINPMHTLVPGTDKLLGYGGSCFPKDTKALLCYMEQKKSKNNVLKSIIKENNEIRNNCL